MCRLWMHEVSRVFEDRLVNETDKEWCLTTMRGLVKSQFSSEVSSVYGHLRSSAAEASVLSPSAGSSDANAISDHDLRKLTWGDFMDAKAKVKVYTEIQDSSRLVSVVEEYLGDYNSMSKKPMDLVMFMFFVQGRERVHVAGSD